jgi:hypothetical protein
MVKTMTMRDDLAWGFAPDQVRKVATGILLAREIVRAAKQPDLLDPVARQINRRAYVERLPKNWMFMPEEDEFPDSSDDDVNT